jgi:indolepyruvate ferredoxin oxidoreductase alpha subunit
MADTVLALLGDEAAALGALHAGLSGAYGYPGTPSTEIMEYLLDAHGEGGELSRGQGGFTAAWCANEKTAFEAALGASFAGKRAIVTMKHVGLNVASDPFMNAALLGIKGGLVIAVADDPGMHSSQNEQDSRFYADFAMIPCLEPRNQQEAYDMARDAFDVSERFSAPVMLRLSTRLSHARAAVKVRPGRERNPLSKAEDSTRWMLLPAFARRNYLSLIGKQDEMGEWSADYRANKLELEGADSSFAVITAGLGGNYYEENLADFAESRGGRVPARFHIGAYPLPADQIRAVCEKAERVIVIEEGQPFIEGKLRGILPPDLTITGKLDGALDRSGELSPDTVRRGLGLPPLPDILSNSLTVKGAQVKFEALDIPVLPGRPPQLCKGCPHGDSYAAIKKAAEGLQSLAITGDIGCYSLGALPPYAVPETIVCMGASVGMARGAADAGLKHVVGVIGDSTFLHSGITGLIDAAAANTPMTLIILDNSTVAMTGCQKTAVPSARLKQIVLGAGVDPAHLLELEAKGQLIEENAAKLRAEIEYGGLSVVIFKRECLEAFRKRQKAVKAEGAALPEAVTAQAALETAAVPPENAAAAKGRGRVKRDIILAGVGGQGALSVAALIAQAAVNAGLNVRQSEVHGMAQRGGAVLAHLRISSEAIASDLAPRGGADLIIAMEPLESLRYAAWLSPEGALVTASEPFINIPDYPAPETIAALIKRFPVYRMVDAAALAKEAGHPRAVNMVMVGAASPFLPIPAETLESAIRAMFAAKTPELAEINSRAFKLGRQTCGSPRSFGAHP